MSSGKGNEAKSPTLIAHKTLEALLLYSCSCLWMQIWRQTITKRTLRIIQVSKKSVNLAEVLNDVVRSTFKTSSWDFVPPTTFRLAVGPEREMAPFTLKHPFINGCGEIPSDKIEDVRRIQSWLKTQSTLPKLTDEHVYMFLHSNYYDIASTQNSITSFYALRISAPEIFLNQSPQSHAIQSGFDVLHMASLPKTTPEGYKVILYKLSDPDPEKFVHLHASKAIILFNDIRQSEDGITPGYMVVCDARGFSFTHLTKLQLHVLRLYLKYMQEAKPIRLKGLHVIYSAKIIDKLVALVKPFMKAELQKTLKIHAGNDLTNFFKYIPQEIMPEDYGGKAESLAVLNEKSRKMIETKYPKWIEEEEAFLLEASKINNKKSKISLNSNEPAESLRNLCID